MGKDRPFLEELSAMFKALGDPTRLGIALEMMETEKCVSEISSSLGISDSSTSHHLRSLRQLKLVKRRREGQKLFYSLDDHHVYLILTIGLEHQEHRRREEER